MATPRSLADDLRQRDDAALARLIHEDAVDVLIDLSGHTAHNRLPVFAFKPAPVQASWLGYFATTGLAEIDYILADARVLPPERAAHMASISLSRSSASSKCISMVPLSFFLP